LQQSPLLRREWDFGLHVLLLRNHLVQIQ